MLSTIKSIIIYSSYTFLYIILADPPGVARGKKKKKIDSETNVTFLYVPADLKVYYQYTLVHKKGGRGS